MATVFIFSWDGIFFVLMAKEILYFTQTFTGFFYAFALQISNPPPLNPPKDITLLMAGPLKRKGDKFPYGILNQSIIATITETFSYL